LAVSSGMLCFNKIVNRQGNEAMAAVLETQTEDLIKETAKKLFFSKGHIQATTQEIADEAGVNRALIHYYFRSRDLLFEQVLQEEMLRIRETMSEILGAKVSLREKINQFLNVFISHLIDYPYIENFIVTEIATNPKKLAEFHTVEIDRALAVIKRQLKEEIKNGTLAPIEIEHFMANMMSMCNYPMIAKPIIQNVFGFDEKAYRKFLLERKKVVYRTIFNEEPPT
jgi:TetR/AcrR family transcriptional regulator